MYDEEKKWKHCDQTKALDHDSMSAWRLEDCPAYADTYIEWCFERRCREYRNGVYILTEWRDRKKQYISYLKASVFDFQHYSRHDDSHSISILEAIEMLLGKDRIDKLSIGDLWLLLESAYSHDLGMNQSYDDLVRLWGNLKFQEYIDKILNDETSGHEAAAFYKVVDNLLRGKVRFDDLEHYLERHPDVAESLTDIQQSWPVVMDRGIQEIVSEFIRSTHAKRLEKSINKLDEKSDPVIPIRLYKLMVKVCVCHGASEYEEILSLPLCEKGFGNSRIHPRFAAALLRMGDLLDMDNNRFNVRALEHYGTLPYLSSLHLKKHRDITHLSIRPERIEAEAVCTELSVCEVTNSWFSMLSKEIKHLICHWNEMAPDDLKGCLLTINPFHIYFEKNGVKRLFSMHPESDFRVDKAKMIELLMGANIYRSRIDFIREYLQNALDATKMKLWMDLKKGRIHYEGHIQQKDNPAELNPLDIGEEIYERYAIEVNVSYDLKTQKVTLTIQDQGIGMEEDCVKVISNIGGGWRTREKYRQALREMPKWLKPTGGFGIGIQSAFMATNKVVITTKGVNEQDGRKIVLSNPREAGRIIQECIPDVEVGTKVKIVFDVNRILDVQSELDRFPYGFSQEHQKFAYEIEDNTVKDDNFFSHKAMQKYVFDFVCNYVEIYFCNTLFPIRITSGNDSRKKWRIINNTTFSKYNVIDRASHILSYKFTLRDKHYLFFYDRERENAKSIIWCEEDASIAVIEFSDRVVPRQMNLKLMELKRKDKETRRGFVCFKNVRVNREISVKDPYMSYYNVFEDFMGFRAEQILRVHREEFSPEFDWRKYSDEFFTVYFKALHTILENNRFDMMMRDNIRRELFQPVAQIIQLLYLKIPFEKVRYGAGEIENLDLNSSQRIRVLKIECSNEEQMIRTTTALENPLLVLQQLDQILRFDKNTDGLVPCLFIMPASFDEEYVGKEILISQACKRRWCHEQSHWSFTQYAQEYFYECLKRREDEVDFQSLPKMLEKDMLSWKQPESDEAWKIMHDIGQSGIIITDNNIVQLIYNYPDFDRRWFRLEKEGNVYIKITKKSSHTEKMSDQEFYSRSYDRIYQASPVFLAKEVMGYPQLIVRQLPIRKESVQEASQSYIISPISKEIFDELEKISSTAKTDKDEIDKISFSVFQDKIIQHDSFIALEQWVYQMQLGLNGEKYTKNEIHEAYLKYIRKIYEWFKETL